MCHYLERLGVEATVFEAEKRAGGVIRSARLEGRLLEFGPQRTRLGPELRALIAELGLEHALLEAPPDIPLYVRRAGRLHAVPFDLRQLRKTHLLSPAGKVRLLLEPLRAPPRPEESVAGFFARSFGPEAYVAFLGPLYGGMYASDPADMSVRHSLLPMLCGLGNPRSLLGAALRAARRGGGIPAPCSLRDGLQMLTDALLAAHTDRVLLAAPVHTLRRAPGGFTSGGIEDSSDWILETDAGMYRASRVVITAPAPAAGAMLEQAAPEAAARLQRLAYNPLAVVHLHSGASLVGYGYQVAFGEPLETRGVTWNASLFGRDGVYTAYLGGAWHAQIVDESDEILGEIARREFETVTGAKARVLCVTRVRMPAYDRSWGALDGLTLPAGLRLCANYESRPGIGGRLRRAAELANELAAEPASEPASEPVSES